LRWPAWSFAVYAPEVAAFVSWRISAIRFCSARRLLKSIEEFTEGMPQTDDIAFVAVEKYR